MGIFLDWCGAQRKWQFPRLYMYSIVQQFPKPKSRVKVHRNCCVTLLIKRDSTNTIAFGVKIVGIAHIQYKLVLTKFEGKRRSVTFN